MANKKYKEALENANTYEEWLEIAHASDTHQGLDGWRRKDESRQFDHVSVRARLDALRKQRKRQDLKGLLFTLNEGIHGNAGGMGKSSLYGYALGGTKHLIEDYIEEVVLSLEAIDNDSSAGLSFEEKSDFFYRASHCFGRTALMLSASGSLFFFHLGAARALLLEDLLPSVVSGSSGGSIAGGLLCSYDNTELLDVLTPEFFLERFPNEEDRVRKDGNRALMLKTILEEVIPDITFQQALEKTGRALNVSIAPAEEHQTSRLLNSVASPEVLIHSGIRASCAVPGFFPPVVLDALDRNGKKKKYLPQREWVDGAVSDDLPAKRLARLFGVNHSVVSQTNPIVIPFIRDGQSGNSLTLMREGAQRAGREWFNIWSKMLDRSRFAPAPVARMNSALRAMVNQEYVGDINIMANYKFVNPFNLLDSPSEKNVRRLFEMGERATWPKIEMIRQQTRISRKLDSILERYDQAMPESAHTRHAWARRAG